MAKKKDNYSVREQIIIYEFATYLRKARAIKELSQVKMAQKLHLSTVYYKKIERKEVNPSLITIFNICRDLEINPSRMIEEIENKVKKKCLKIDDSEDIREYLYIDDGFKYPY